MGPAASPNELLLALPNREKFHAYRPITIFLLLCHINQVIAAKKEQSSYPMGARCYRTIPGVDNGDAKPKTLSWLGFKQKYDKHYDDPKEEQKRYKIFTSTMIGIIESELR
ncbi:hypothetical protein ACOME3_008596 [Neoechinorhynchus agilis]